jgi:putative Mn2+ efflux pump MntP
VNIIKFVIIFFVTFILTLILSVDDFSVGVAYGLHKTKMRLKPMAIMMLGSVLSTCGLLLLGSFVSTFLSDTIVAGLSTLILWTIGCKMIYQGWTEKEDGNEIIEKTPFSASRQINPWEPFFLGLAVGFDDFAVALGLAVAGFPVILAVFLMKVSQVISVSGGNYLAFKGFSKKVNGKLSILPGIVLILVGLYRIFS